METMEVEMPPTHEHLRIIQTARNLLAQRPDKYQRNKLAKAMGLKPAQVTKILGSGKKKIEDDKYLRKGLKIEWVNAIKKYFAEDWPSDNKLPESATPHAAPRIDEIHFKQQYIPNAILGGLPPGTGKKMAVFGAATCGKHGEFPFNGEVAEYVDMPPMLEGVPDAYAVYVMGDSMEKLYRVGEYVYVHPKMQFHKGDPVIAQIKNHEDDDASIPPLAYLKTFISMDDRRLVLEQENPREMLKFPRSMVVSVHRVVGKMLRGM